MSLIPLLLRHAATLAFLAAVFPAGAEVTLRLSDGRLISGAELRRDGAVYLLALDEFTSLSLPAVEVVEVLLSGEGREPDATPESAAQEEAGAETSEVEPDTWLNDPRRGRWSEPPTSSLWEPVSDYTAETDVTEFSPSTWPPFPVDPFWTPVSDYSAETDVTEFSPVVWSTQPTPYLWEPEDGFDRFLESIP